MAGPFGLPCGPEAAQVLADGKETSENPVGPEFCAAKVFRALPEEPGSERVWRSAKEDVLTWEVLRNEFRAVEWPTCYECEFEPKAVGLNEATRVIVSMTKTWFHRQLP